jgi:TRAP-type mannitol/chloroaromatic compound transport system permease small subunit
VEALLSALRRANRAVGLACGAALFLTGTFILVEIVLRQAGGALGGSDEISGYAMAGIAAWGAAYALTERAHVRIDLIQRRLAPKARAALDLLALTALTATAAIVAFYAWDVLAKTLARGSRANTPLETPLWIPQSIWFAGWVWFALSALALLAIATALVLRGELAAAERAAGAVDELQAETGGRA